MKRCQQAELVGAVPPRRPQQSHSQAALGRARLEERGTGAMGCWAVWAAVVMTEVGLAVFLALAAVAMWKVAQAMPVRALMAVAVEEVRLVGVVTSTARGMQHLLDT